MRVMPINIWLKVSTGKVQIHTSLICGDWVVFFEAELKVMLQYNLDEQLLVCVNEAKDCSLTMETNTVHITDIFNEQH